MPPLWLTIDTTPGMSRSVSASIVLNDAVSPVAVLMMPMQLGPHSLRPLSRHTASSSRWRAAARVAGFGEAAGPRDRGGHAGVDAFLDDVDDRLRGHGENREIRDCRKLAQARKARNPPTVARPGLIGHTGPA